MERVTGIGGFFFAAGDPGTLAGWYERHLGVGPAPSEDGDASWRQEAGETVFAPAGPGAEHLGGRSWALNFRVRDLDAMVAQLRAAGIEVAVHEESYDYGRFADLHDPEDNPIQLWEPAGADGYG